MPTPTSPPSAELLSRRAVLAGALVVAGGALSACTADRPSDDRARRGRPAQPEVDPDVALAATALGDVRRTLELVDATAEQHPRLREVLASPRAVHEQHVDFLAGAAPAGAPSPSPSVTASPQGRPRGAVRRNQERALADVLRAEQQLATAMTTHALAARSGAFARALGSIGAAAAQQAAALPAGVLDGAGGPR